MNGSDMRETKEGWPQHLGDELQILICMPLRSTGCPVDSIVGLVVLFLMNYLLSFYGLNFLSIHPLYL